LSFPALDGKLDNIFSPVVALKAQCRKHAVKIVVVCGIAGIGYMYQNPASRFHQNLNLHFRQLSL